MDSLHPRTLDVSAREADSSGGYLLRGLRVPLCCVSDRDPGSRGLHGGMCQLRGHAVSMPHWWFYGEERRASLGQEPAAGGSSPILCLFLSDGPLSFCPVLEAQTTAFSCMSQSMSTVPFSGRRGD